MFRQNILLFVSLFLVQTILAQSGNNDPTFNVLDDCSFGDGSGFNNNVNSVQVQADGKILVGGSFTSFNGIGRNKIARLNIDGSLDSTFNPGTGFDTTVNAISIQVDGKVIVGGNFSTFNGVTRNRIARLNVNGTLDTSFNPGIGFNNSIYTIAIRSDGRIIVGGNFSTFNGLNRGRIALLNIDGTSNTGFNSGVGFNGGPIYSIVMQPDGKFIVGGSFSTYQNGPITNINDIARFTAGGSLDLTFNPGTGFNSDIKVIAIQPDGKIIVGGDFTRYNSTTNNAARIVRLDSVGTLDTTFNPGAGFNSSVNSISIQPDGKIVVGGQFTTFNGTTRNSIVRITNLGGLDSTFTIGTGFGNGVLTTAIQSDGKIIVGGIFTAYNGSTRNKIARLNINGVNDSFFYRRTVDGYVFATSIQPDGKIVVGGSFTNFNGIDVNGIVRLNTDGSTDTTFRSALNYNNPVTSLAIQADGKIVVGGSFGIRRLNSDGSLDLTFNPGTGFNGYIYTISIQTDGKIIAGGAFTIFNGTTRNRIARLNSNGSLDLTFNPGTGFNDQVNTISIQQDGKIIVGGNFTTFNGVTHNRLVRLTTIGSWDATFNILTGFNGSVRSSAIQTDGKIVVGGSFNNFNPTLGTGFRFITRLITDGSIDTTFLIINGGLNGTVYTTSIQPDGKIIVGGSFTQYDQISRNKIARLNSNGTLDISFDPGTGFNDNIVNYNNTTVNTTIIQMDGKIIAGGDFSTFNGICRTRIARLEGLCTGVTPAPIGAASQTFCIGSTIADLIANGNSIQWYSTSNGNTPLANSTPIVNGATYYATEIITGCESTTRLAVTATIIPLPAAPSGASNQLFCTGATIANLVANGTTIKWYISASGGTPWSSSSTLANGFTYYASQTISGCEGTSRLAVTVNIINAVAPSGSASQVLCSGTTISGLVANGTNIQWYSSATDTIPLSTSLLLINGRTYYASQTISGCESNSRLAVAVSLTYTAAPTGSAFQTFCTGSTVANLVANGTIIQWYSAANGGSPLSSSTLLTTGTTYYASQTASSCESSTRFAVAVTLTNIPAPTGSSTQTFCNSATISNLVANGTSLQWFSLSSGGTAVLPSTPLVNNMIYYAAQTVSGCQSTTRLAVTVNINVPAAPSGSATQAFCNGATIANLVANGSNIQWYSTASGGTALSASALLTNGATYYATQTVSGCTSSPRLAVTVSISSSIAYSEICLVSVDNNDRKNIVIWEKAFNQRIEYYKIYKQNTINSQYDSIAYVPIDSFSVFKDFNSNPSQQSDSYKISAVDSCGIEGPVLTAHVTIHLTANQGVNNNVNLLWNAYSGFTYPNFEIYRSNNGAPYTLIGTVANSSFSYTDVTPPAGTNYYYVSVTKPIPCNPAKAAPVLKSNSNILDALGNQVISSSEPLNIKDNIVIYPNPTKDLINISASTNFIGKNYRIFDYTGKLLQSKTIQSENTSLNLADLPSGLYLLRIEGNNESYKIVKL